jgi:WS/DGAT/MGAT family acyltransferase
MSNLNAERGPIHVHVGATIIVEAAAPSYDQLVAHVEKRLLLVPRFRQRIVKIPLGIENPVWGDDPRFDIRRHVRHVSVPRPGRLDQLRDIVGRVMSEPLDMDRPLWQLYLVEGLSGRHAYISKTHHALVDGVAAVDVGTILLDTSKRGTRMKRRRCRGTPTSRAPRCSSPRQRPSGCGSRCAPRAARPARRSPRQARPPDGAAHGRGLHQPASGGPQVPRSPLNVKIGRDRRIAWSRTDLDRLKRARHRGGLDRQRRPALRGAGALRRYLERRGDRVPDYLVALVPVSIRRPDEKGELGNRLSTIMVRLPLTDRSSQAARAAPRRDSSAEGIRQRARPRC